MLRRPGLITILRSSPTCEPTASKKSRSAVRYFAGGLGGEVRATRCDWLGFEILGYYERVVAVERGRSFMVDSPACQEQVDAHLPVRVAKEVVHPPVDEVGLYVYHVIDFQQELVRLVSDLWWKGQ